MPKVETSLTKGGNLNKSNRVSQIIGNKSNFKNVRQTRDVSDEDITQKPKTRQKVIKKLIRIEPVSKKTIVDNKDSNNLHINNEQTEPIVATTRRPRRKLRIKKKKRRLLNNPIHNNDYENEEHLQEATKPRRKIVITRKRLLPNKSDFNKTEFSIDSIIPSKSTNIFSSSTTKLLQHSFIDHISYTDQSGQGLSRGNLITENYKTDITEHIDFDFSTDEMSTEENYLDDNSDEDTTEILDNDDQNKNFINNSDEVDLEEEGEDDADENEDNFPTESDIDYDSFADATEGKTKTKHDSHDDGNENEENATIENIIESSEIADDYEINNQPTFQDIPEYEPSFPELTESFDAPILLLKTTVLSAVETLTKTTVQSRLRTYTFVVTRVSGNEQIITTTTEVKPQIKTIVITEPFTSFTTLTLLDFDATQTLTEIQNTKIPALDNPQPQLLNQGESSFV